MKQVLLMFLSRSGWGRELPPCTPIPHGPALIQKGGGQKAAYYIQQTQCTADCRPNVLIHVMLSSKHGKNCSFWSFQNRLSIIKVKKKVLGPVPGTVPDYSK